MAMLLANLIECTKGILLNYKPQTPELMQLTFTATSPSIAGGG